MTRPTQRRQVHWFPGQTDIFLAIAACLAVAGPASDAIRATEIPEPGFVSLFDGKTLQGWEGNREVFRVQDGAIVAGNLKERISNNEFLCTKAEFDNFELRLEAKLIGEGKNAGVQFRSRRIPDHHEVKGYQYDIGVMRDKPIWGWLYDESRRRRFLGQREDDAFQQAIEKDDWNDLVIRCEGPKVQLWVNGVQSVDYREADQTIEANGLIGLQIHGGPPAEAWYRNIRIRKLQ